MPYNPSIDRPTVAAEPLTLIWASAAIVVERPKASKRYLLLGHPITAVGVGAAPSLPGEVSTAWTCAAGMLPLRRTVAAQAIFFACPYRKLWNGPPLLPAILALPNQERNKPMMTIAVLDIDLGKSACSLVGLDETGRWRSSTHKA